MARISSLCGALRIARSMLETEVKFAVDLLHVHLVAKGITTGYEVYKQYAQSQAICASTIILPIGNMLKVIYKM